MPKYQQTTKPYEFLDESKTLTERYNIFSKVKRNLLAGEKNPCNCMYIFILYLNHFESLIHDFEEDPDVEQFDDTDIDNVMLKLIDAVRQQGLLTDMNKHLLNEKINKQCAKEGRTPLMPQK